MKVKVLTMGLLGLALSGCGHVELIGHTMSAREWGDPLVFEALKNQTPVGSPFTQALARNYTEFAVNQREEGDLRNFEVFARKALLSAEGVVIDPELPDRWDLDKLNYAPRTVTVSYAEAYQWRTRLLNAFYRCTRDRNAEAAAKAQASYDSLIEELEEGWETAEINATKEAFLTAVEQVEQSCVPASTYKIYFDTNKSNIRKHDLKVIEEIAARIKASGANVSVSAPEAGKHGRLANVVGWADTRASAEYNLALSQRRAESVKAALIAAGVDANGVTTLAEGETNLPVPTSDNVNEQRNRVAYVTVYVGTK